MTHPLYGARLKVVRAQEHLKSFNEDAWRYINTEPYQVESKIEGNHICVEGVITAEPPPALACIVGDFVTNLRASLDYIAWELAMLAGNPLTDGQKRKVSFPIASTQANFAKAGGTAEHLRNVCGVPAEAMSVVESVQPYHAGYEPLSALDLLVRTDKHRTLLLCASFVESVGTILIHRGDRLALTAFGMRRMEMNLAAPSPPLGPATDYSVTMDEKPTIFVSIKDFPSPSQSTHVMILQQILNCVERVIPKFDSCFP
jgi:hypothetical protein